MDGRLASVRRAAARAAPAALDDLEAWLRIPSVSGTRDVRRAAAWVEAYLRRGGTEVRRLPGPVVVGRTRGRGGATTVVYGHLDVKPPGPGWTTPPFRPVRRGHRLQARGASDDKGQVMSHLVALGAWARAGGPPGDVVTIIDGAEEVGSPGLATALAGLREPVAGVVVVDTRSAGPRRPTVTLSQRGAVPVRLTVDVGGRPVHAGRLGGAVVDPSLVLARLLDRATRVLDDLPLPPPPWPAHPTATDLRAESRGRAVHADDPVGRATRRGVLTINRLQASAGAGAVPTRATAVVDVRVPPGVSPGAALRRLAADLRRRVPAGVRLELRAGPGAAGALLAPSPRIRAAVDAACRASYGRPATTAASGGSIRAVGVLRRVFGVTPVLLGLGPEDDGAHGPDEHLDLREWPVQIDVHVILLDRVAALGTTQLGHGMPAFDGATVRNACRDMGRGTRALRTREPG
ncbi:M20/M25/M40 family metallo-hydrolase [Nocardioides mangrovi]|uniref:M20/M25/M40 family metallo-hydrolase n=1 Tax=Nocardioides mangrovi TaxID=2874580 RepID=A0ABS7UJK4_9ACTN|nr:M20/M25/M40 family metallo-hydrolase [Nocardioides mangrovi]MBZ5741067.1 M20/M25/M40 family metallo-hydrolase [Nocardioides mangrovi]